MKIVTFDIITD